MEYRINEEGNIEVVIKANNAGKFRFKKRQNRFSFGKTFSTRNKPFDEQTYLEWQIGYDVPVRNVEVGNVEVKLKEQSFVGSNDKKKYPAELSELFYITIKQSLISKEEVEKLFEEICVYRELIDKKTISVEKQKSQINLNGIKFEETSINLPTLFMIETLDGTQVEVSIKQQQYASGVQPMVYFCIPLTSFRNSSEFLGKPSNSGDKLIYVINKKNVQNLVNLIRIFGMASERHKHDIVQIIRIILEAI